MTMLFKVAVAKNTTSSFWYLNTNTKVSLFLDGTNALRETTTTHSLNFRTQKKRQRKRGRERERLFLEDFLLALFFA